MRKSKEELVAAICNVLGVGKKNALSRSDLVVITGASDRQVREAIESLRRNQAILTLPEGNGYYIPEKTLQGRLETERWMRMQNHRVRSIKAAQKGARDFLNGGKAEGIHGQLSMFGGDDFVGKDAEREGETWRT